MMMISETGRLTLPPRSPFSMNGQGHTLDGAFRSVGLSQKGFTLLEICIVLLIIAILLGVMLPAIQTAFVESAMRVDASRIDLMVKSGVLESSDQHQVYVMDIDSKKIDLHPVPSVGTNPGDNSTKHSTDADSVPGEVTYALDPANELLIPNPKGNPAWIKIPATAWIFQPGGLCPATRIRLARGRAWLEMSFNALTGNVEEEGSYLP
jgi:prepilin-type N-terminal cleavage/methylation domain-containing protein